MRAAESFRQCYYSDMLYPNLLGGKEEKKLPRVGCQRPYPSFRGLRFRKITSISLPAETRRKPRRLGLSLIQRVLCPIFHTDRIAFASAIVPVHEAAAVLPRRFFTDFLQPMATPPQFEVMEPKGKQDHR